MPVFIRLRSPGDFRKVYASGRRTIDGQTTNRLVLDKFLTVQSVNGPQVTAIDGGRLFRCAYLTNGASLSGFTLTNGATRDVYDPTFRETGGGGVYCESESAVVYN